MEHRKEPTTFQNWFPYARMRDVVVVAKFTEGIPATVQLALRADGYAAVSTLGDSDLAARHSIIAVA